MDQNQQWEPPHNNPAQLQQQVSFIDAVKLLFVNFVNFNSRISFIVWCCIDSQMKKIEFGSSNRYPLYIQNKS